MTRGSSGGTRSVFPPSVLHSFRCVCSDFVVVCSLFLRRCNGTRHTRVGSLSSWTILNVPFLALSRYVYIRNEMCVYQCACIYVNSFIGPGSFICTGTMRLHVCLCMYVQTYACMYACMHVCMYLCIQVYVCMHACMYACMHECMHVCIQVWAPSPASEP